MVQYQLTGCDSTATLSALVLDSVAPSIAAGDNVVNISMRIQKFFMDTLFGVVVVDGNTNSNDTLCTRSNVLQANLQLLQANYQQADDVLTANSVGKTLGMSVPVSNPSRLKELVDIMTQATQDTLETEIVWSPPIVRANLSEFKVCQDFKNASLKTDTMCCLTLISYSLSIFRKSSFLIISSGAFSDPLILAPLSNGILMVLTSKAKTKLFTQSIINMK